MHIQEVDDASRPQSAARELSRHSSFAKDAENSPQRAALAASAASGGRLEEGLEGQLPGSRSSSRAQLTREGSNASLRSDRPPSVASAGSRRGEEDERRHKSASPEQGAPDVAASPRIASKPPSPTRNDDDDNDDAAAAAAAAGSRASSALGELDSERAVSP
jgi:hypothetical protein